jgi:hypothetical protein
MKDRDRVKLLFGPYCLPRLRRGDRAACWGWAAAPAALLVRAGAAG